MTQPTPFQYIQVEDSLGVQWLMNPETQLKSKRPEDAKAFSAVEAQKVFNDLTRLGFKGLSIVDELPGARKMTQQTEKNDVPVTAAFLDLVDILQCSKQRFMAETRLAKALGLPEPQDYWIRCKELFNNEFGDQLKAVGVSLNEISFRSLMDLRIPDEVNETLFDELPKRFAFDPWLGMGKGGIKRVEQELQRERQHA